MSQTITSPISTSSTHLSLPSPPAKKRPHNALSFTNLAHFFKRSLLSSDSEEVVRDNDGIPDDDVDDNDFDNDDSDPETLRWDAQVRNAAWPVVVRLTMLMHRPL